MSLDRNKGHLLALHVNDDAEPWRRAGFSVVDDAVVLEDVIVFLIGGGGGDRGIAAWSLQGVSTHVDGLESIPHPLRARSHTSADHPNGVASIDHLVVQTADFGRTIPALESVGLELRRTRTFDFGGTQQQQSFFWLGSTILEVVGPAVPPEDAEASAAFWGLALTCPDLEATVEHLGVSATPVKPAVQRGRFISTLKTREFDISVPIALMSPHVSREPSG